MYDITYIVSLRRSNNDHKQYPISLLFLKYT